MGLDEQAQVHQASESNARMKFGALSTPPPTPTSVVEIRGMIYQGNAITVARSNESGSEDIATLTFDHQGESVNTLSSAVIAELSEAVKAIQAESGLKGLVLASGKEAFIVGADITEFQAMFGKGAEFLESMLRQ